MRSEITLSDAEIEAIFDSLHHAVTAKQLIYTRDTIEDFESKRRTWQAPGEAPERRLVMGLATWTARNARARDDQPCADVVVVDFGAVRGVYGPSS